MFLIFKPPQSYLQVQLLDPDGFRKHVYDAYELELASQILEERKAKRKKKVTTLDLKKRIKEKLDEGQTLIEVATSIADEIIAEEPQFELTPEMKVNIDRIMADYKAQIANETRQMVVDFIEQIRALEFKSLALERERLREEDNYRRYQEEKKRRDLKMRKLKILLLLASLEEDE
jgi:hypothetical protein